MESARSFTQPLPRPSNVSHYFRLRSSPAFGSKVHCLMAQKRVGPPVGHTPDMPHHTFLPAPHRCSAWDSPPGETGSRAGCYRCMGITRASGWCAPSEGKPACSPTCILLYLL